MKRLLMFLLGLGALGWAGYRFVQTSSGDPAAPVTESGPKRTLDHVRETAKSMESDMQRRADELGQTSD